MSKDRTTDERVTRTRLRLAYPIQEGFGWLGVGNQRGYDLINAGLLQSYLVGRRRFCTHKALEECLEKLQQGKGAGSAKKAA